MRKRNAQNAYKVKQMKQKRQPNEGLRAKNNTIQEMKRIPRDIIMRRF